MTANLWKSYTFTVPISEAGSSTVPMLSYDSTLSRVRVDLTALYGAPTTTTTTFTGTFDSPKNTYQNFTVPAGLSTLQVTLSGDGSGDDLDLYLYQGTQADYVTYWNSTGPTDSESITVNNPTAGSYQIMVSSITVTGGAAPWTAKVMQTTAASAPAGSVLVVQRSTDLVRWTTVRGGASIPIESATVPLDDYEFAANVDNQYRVQVYNGTDLVHTFTDHITPIISTRADRVWWKDIARPYLNRQVRVQDFSEVTRSSRAGVFDIVGSSTPTIVTDTLSSRKYTLTVLTEGLAAAQEFDTVVAVGGIIFLQAPADSMVPTGYFAVTGDVSVARPGRLSKNRFFALPLTECAAPAADVVGATTTWDAVVAKYATWNDVLVDADTWTDMVEQVASVDLVTP